MNDLSINFSNNEYLLLLLFLPIFIFVGWPRSVYRRRRDLVSLLIRLLLVTLIILGLAGLELPKDADYLAVVFLVDVSDSIDRTTQQAALDYVRTSIEEMDANRDKAAVILFGANAVVEQPMTAALDLSQLGASPITLNTDLAEAIRLGLALFPPDTAKRMVILSDGIETVGDAESAARLAEATSVQIDYVPLTRVNKQEEILVSNVVVPPHVNEEEIFDLTVTVESEYDTNAELRVLAGGEIIHQEDISLRAGENSFVIGPLSWPGTGFVDFRVQIEPQGVDNFYQNNELSAFTEVRGRPSVLLVAQDEREIEFLQPALEENGLVVNVVKPRDLPSGLPLLSAYNSIVLVNTPATMLTPSQMELLQVYVRDLGGGLVAVGGPNSYGVGGYFQTPLEETLPVEMRIRNQERIPTLTMLFVIDRSGSMEIASNPQGVTNLELAKEAIIRSFNLLNDYDRTGVVSFDTQAYFVLEIQEVGDASNRAAMETTVASLRPGGGTDIFGALGAANDILPSDPSVLKHIILLTDGGANPAGTMELANSLYTKHDITLSVVAVGQGYAPWLQSLSQAGRGNFHEAIDVTSIPSIFTQETILATRSYIFEETFVPDLTSRSPIMDGITGLPSLEGYVATTDKDTATVVLRGPEEDPILAQWQYGLGRSVAFTSDASARWGVNWVTWEQYSRFWGQTVRWTITEGATNNLEVRIEHRGEQAYLVVDARDDDGELLNGLNLKTSVVTPTLESQELTVPQVAPGKYELAFTPEQEGAYFMRVVGSGTDGVQNFSVAQTAGWVLSYSAEYRLADTDNRFLGRIAGITGGGSLAGNPAGVFVHDLTYQKVYSSVWSYLLTLAAFLLLLDIAVRRIVVNQRELERVRQVVFGVASRRPSLQTSERMSSLKAAKERASVPQSDEKPVMPAQTPAQSQSRPRAVPRSSPSTKVPEVKAEGNIASRLLKSRQRDDE